MNKSRTAGLVGHAREQLVKRFLVRQVAPGACPPPSASPAVPEEFCRFDRHPGYERLLVPRAAAARFGVADPYFKVHEGIAGATTQVDGRSLSNFSSYNYLGLCGHAAVAQAAREAIERFGTSASASRLVAGERPVQRELEEELARYYGVDDCIVFVSGHATNVSSIGYLFGPRDLIVHDALIHNSVLEGARLSGATRRAFPHNDAAALDAILGEIRGRFERVLIVVEGLYSMDGDVADLPAFIAVKRRHQAFLMVDEAHSLGVLGERGGGIREHFGMAGGDVDIWMGTLSKTLAGCGGYIAGERALVDNLKYSAPGFVYSVGIAPPIAAASLAALRILGSEPERVERLRRRARRFFDLARRAGIDTGRAEGYAVVPAIVGSSLKAARISAELFARGINVQPILYPAVEERAARLRFFLSSEHGEEQIAAAVHALAELVHA